MRAKARPPRDPHPGKQRGREEESAIKLATFKTDEAETLSASALRFRALMSRFEPVVERHAKGRTPRSAMTATLWQHSLPPALQLLQSGEKPGTSFKEAVERVRRHEAARLTGTISALPLTTPRVHQRQHGHQQGAARRNTNKHRPRQLPVQQKKKTRPFRTYSIASTVRITPSCSLLAAM